MVAAVVVEAVVGAGTDSRAKLASWMPVCNEVVLEAVASVLGESTGRDCSKREVVSGENDTDAPGSERFVTAPMPAPSPPPPTPTPPPAFADRRGINRGDAGLPRRAAAEAGGSFGMTRRRPPDFGDDTAAAPA